MIEFFTFLLCVAVGAFIQTITGFAMGLIIIGGVTLFGLADISFAAAVISLISLVNTGVALRSTYKFVNYRYLKEISFSLVPMMIIGVLVLNYLSGAAYGLLKAILGVVIITAGILLMLKPSTNSLPATRFKTMLTGSLGGVIAGMFSAGGAPLAYFMYREPLTLVVVRATLLSFFAVSTLGRTIIVAIDGQLSEDVLVSAAVSIPVVVLVTMGTVKISHLIPDSIVRKIVFILLILMGLLLIADSLINLS